MGMKILVIDDERTFNEVRLMAYVGIGNLCTNSNRQHFCDWNHVTYARSLRDAASVIRHDWDVVFLDHDLGEDAVRSLTYDIERWAYQDGIILPIGMFVIHSMNPIGRMEMHQALHGLYNVEFVNVGDLL